MLDSQEHNNILIYIYIYIHIYIYMYSGRWCFADQLHVSALYIGHHQVGIINLIGNYTNVHGWNNALTH